MNRSRFALVICLCILGLAAVGWAQERPTPSAQKLIVGVKEAPPFAIKQADNTWSGLSIELWQAIAMDLHLSGPAHMTQDIYGKKFFPTPLNQCRVLSRT